MYMARDDYNRVLTLQKSHQSVSLKETICASTTATYSDSSGDDEYSSNLSIDYYLYHHDHHPQDSSYTERGAAVSGRR